MKAPHLRDDQAIFRDAVVTIALREVAIYAILSERSRGCRRNEADP